MPEAAITLEEDQIVVRGSGFEPNSRVEMEVVETAENADRRRAHYRPTVAGPVPDPNGPPGTMMDHPAYPHGAVDFSEPLLFGNGTVKVEVRTGDELVAEEVFNLG